MWNRESGSVLRARRLNKDHTLLFLDQNTWVLSARTGIPIYDFDFRAFFPSTSPCQRNAEITAVSRTGAIEDYDATYAELLAEGIRLIHSPEVHYRASRLPDWYPLIRDVTPRSRWFSEIPTPQEVEQEFTWPVFVKGDRQTSRHQRSLAIIHTPDQFLAAMEAYRDDSILRWQQVVVREFVPLRLVDDADQNRIPSSFEFRTFWWRNQCVGSGRYWWDGRHYTWSSNERAEGLALAEDVAKRVNAPFLVIDIAMRTNGNWIVIECNDGQESGYAGMSPIGVWQNILCIEKASCRRDDSAIPPWVG